MKRPMAVAMALGWPALAAARPKWIEDGPAAWVEVWWGLEVWQWAGLVVLLAAACLAGWLTFSLLVWVFRLERRLGPDGTRLFSGRGIKRLASALVIAFTYAAMIRSLALPEPVARGLGLALYVIESALVVGLLATLWSAAVDVYAIRRQHLTRKAETLVLPFARKLGSIVVVALGVAAIVAGLGYNVGGFLAGLGIGGIAVALAAKNSVENLFGSLSLMLDVPFGVGDWVKIGAVSGVVEEIGLRTTRIRTFEDALVTLPNSMLTQSPVENLGMRRRRRMHTHMWLCHAADPERIEGYARRLREEIAAQPEVIAEDVGVSLYDATLDGFDVQIVVYFDVASFPEEMACRQRVLTAAIRLASDSGLAMATRGGQEREGR